MILLNPEQIAVRPAMVADSAWAYEIKKAALGPYIAQVFGWDEGQQLRFHADEYDPLITRIILYDHTQIGYYSVHVVGNILFINELYLTPTFQGKGIGGHVLQTLLQEADEHSYCAKLNVLKVNPARRLYERYGFSTIGEDAHFYHMERQPQGVMHAEKP